MKSKLVPIVIASFVAGIMAAPLLWNLDATLPLSSSADAAQVEKPADDALTEKDAPEYSPVKARARDFYTPNSEDLRPNEMRLIACGTGMPTARPKQAASCWLLELGNGDKFIFDIGTGSAE